jgi:hypothetical protein
MGQQPIKRYHIRRPDGSWSHQIGKIAGADDVSDDEIQDDIERRRQQPEHYEAPDDDEDEPDEEEATEDEGESEDDLDMERLKELIKKDPVNANRENIGYARRGKKKRKKNKPVIINKKTTKTVKKAFRNFLYKRPKKKNVLTWRPRLDRHPKPKNIKFFQGKKQPQRRSIIKRR